MQLRLIRGFHSLPLGCIIVPNNYMVLLSTPLLSSRRQSSSNIGCEETMNILDKLVQFLFQGVVYVPIYAVLFYHFLRYVNVTDKVWKRSFILATAAYCILTMLSVIFGVLSAAWIGQFIGALVIAYILTKMLIVPYYNAAAAAIMIAIIGYDVPPLVLKFINENVLSYT